MKQRHQLAEHLAKRLELHLDAQLGNLEGEEPLADHLRKAARKEAAGAIVQSILDTIAYATEPVVTGTGGQS